MKQNTKSGIYVWTCIVVMDGYEENKVFQRLKRGYLFPVLALVFIRFKFFFLSLARVFALPQLPRAWNKYSKPGYKICGNFHFTSVLKAQFFGRNFAFLM